MNDLDAISQKIINYTLTHLWTTGIALGTVVSYIAHKSIAWAAIHGLFSWGYVFYYIIKNAPV